jgi:hypothetical protein
MSRGFGPEALGRSGGRSRGRANVHGATSSLGRSGWSVLGVSVGGLLGLRSRWIAGVSNGWVRVVVAQCAEVAVADHPRAVGHSWRASVQQGRAAAPGRSTVGCRVSRERWQHRERIRLVRDFVFRWTCVDSMVESDGWCRAERDHL